MDSQSFTYLPSLAELGITSETVVASSRPKGTSGRLTLTAQKDYEEPGYYYNHHRPKDRRRKGQDKSVHSLTDLRDRHHEIIRRIVLGQSNIEIAQALNISTQSVSNVRCDSLVMERAKELQNEANGATVDVLKRVAEILPKALENIESILDDDDCNRGVKLRAAQDILDRAGYAPVKRFQSENVHATLTREDIEEIKNRAKANSGERRVEEQPFEVLSD